ncbi:MAG: hydantoinase B/oxoprolinase family protein, partial [Dehalococcoidia bacterium]|nr:hydantoinase B/oxoprolinase family protein [Dehalococcoidia bacterium]
MPAEKTPVDSAIDPITFEVIRHKLRAIIDEQEITLKSVSGSPIVTEASDFSNGIYLSDGSSLMFGRQSLVHADSVASMVRNTIADCEENPGIDSGDQFIVNDPWKGAVHASDVGIVSPIFYEGKRVGWAGALAHQIDVGGMEFGSWCPKAVDRYQEGFNLPPLKIVENGKLRQDVWNMIMSASRLPFLIGLDLRAMIAANNVARRRFTALIERYGLDTVLNVANGLLAHSERRLRERLKELPDGIYRAVDFIDHDGHENRVYKVNITLTKAGDSLTFDFTGSSPQAPGFINCTHTGLPGAVLGAVYPMLAYDIPWNEGLARTVKIVAPKGMVCNAESPAPTSAAVCATAWVALNAATAAVSKLVSCSDKYRRELEAVANGSFVTLNLGGL